MSTVKEPLHPLRTARYLWLGILLCALVGGACFLGGRWSAGRSETAKIDTVVLQNQLSEIRELATVTYAYTNMAQFESSNDFYGVKIPFTTKSFILTYDGTVKAGVDLDGAEVSVSGTTVTITLPEAEILSHEIDEDSMEVFDEKTSIFNPFTVEDFTSFQSDQKAAMEEKALSRGLLAEARAKAVSSVEQLFAAALPDTYTVTVQYKTEAEPRLRLFSCQDIVPQGLRRVRQMVRPGVLQLLPAPKSPGDAAGRQAAVVGRLHIHAAVSHKQRLLRAHCQVGQQSVDARRVRLHRHSLDLAPHQMEDTGKVVFHDLPAKAVRLVGVNRQGHSPSPQPLQQCRDAVIGPCLVHVVGAVIGGKLGESIGQQQGTAALLRRKPPHQIGDSMAHHGLELLCGVLRPAVPAADPVSGIGQVLNRVQQGAVQVKDHCMIHGPSPLFFGKIVFILSISPHRYNWHSNRKARFSPRLFYESFPSFHRGQGFQPLPVSRTHSRKPAALASSAAWP